MLPLVFIMLVRMLIAVQITDVTNNPGVTPIKIEDAFIISHYHTFARHLDLSKLRGGLDELRRHARKLSGSDKVLGVEVGTVFTDVQNKLEHLISEEGRSKNMSSESGLDISWLSDIGPTLEEKYIRIIQHQKNRVLGDILSDKISVKFSPTEFEKDLELINSNLERIESLLEHDESSSEFHLLIMNLIIIQNRLNKIILSLQFCETNTIHSSIITNKELSMISKDVHISVMRELGKVYCALAANKVHYFVELPVYTSPKDTYFLMALPFLSGYQALTVLPKFPLVISDQNELWTSVKCSMLRGNFYCHRRDMLKITDECVEQIMTKTHLDACKETEVINKPLMKYYPIVNVYSSFHQKRVVLNVSGVIQVHSLPLGSLIRLADNEAIVGKVHSLRCFGNNLCESHPVESLSLFNIDTETLDIDGAVFKGSSHVNVFRVITHYIFICVITLCFILTVILVYNLLFRRKYELCKS